MHFLMPLFEMVLYRKMENKTISFLLPNYGYYPIGGFRIIYQLANKLVRRGYNVKLVHTASVRDWPRRPLGWIRTIMGKSNAYDWFCFEPQVDRIFVSSLDERNIPDADVIVATSFETSKYMMRYGVSKGRKLYYVQGIETWSASISKVVDSWKYPCRKLVISSEIIDTMNKFCVEDIVYLPNPIDLSVYHCNEKNIFQMENCLIMMCSSDTNKDTSTGISVIYKVIERHPRLKVKAFGVCKRPKELPEACEYYCNPKQDTLIHEIYGKGTIFLCTSVYEGWGLPPMEAMACGCAVVTTDCGGIRNFCDEGVNASICNVGDADALAGAVSELINDRKKRIMYIEAGLKRMRDFDMDSYVKRFIDATEVL